MIRAHGNKMLNNRPSKVSNTQEPFTLGDRIFHTTFPSEDPQRNMGEGGISNHSPTRINLSDILRTAKW